MLYIPTLNYFLYYELLVLLTVRHHPLALHPESCIFLNTSCVCAGPVQSRILLDYTVLVLVPDMPSVCAVSHVIVLWVE